MKESTSDITLERRRWLAQLARAPRATLERAIEAVCEGAPPAFDWLRAPQTGLAMVRGRIGGTGDPFNAGEATVTRAVLRLKSGGEPGAVGIAYQLGRDKRRAELAALADAMLQTARFSEALRAQLVVPLARMLDEKRCERAQQTASSRVDFYTMVRGE
ncbi:MAG: alpha-D-ribose 1-methylphosphonate 5-triphosphate synthase subunit PhnG [Paraburkholderia sp.]|jgi:alpha-D-ribose 1-methylphosphonate 5-triphosphate synthase subunit PhnG|nr:alpha-D-ribose 1-methylphosphonate 5-triphosphate synthase subunit PhnG [Paraburkholderia sp.]MEA3120472.1 alpha-D-ribose 1-methylphosphonate 5-triphosphate synthase subunit PhnG [Paraburkholderia sp.]